MHTGRTVRACARAIGLIIIISRRAAARGVRTKFLALAQRS
jgi:hypothetical protein